MPRHPRTSIRQPRRSFVLLAVLVVVVLLTLAAYQFSELMLAEYSAADSYARSAQAHALADSGVHFAAAALSNSNTLTNTLNGNPFNNPQAFQGILVNPQALPHFQGRFSVIAALDPDDPNASSQPYRFGVTDESGKINLNALMQLDSSGKTAHDMLMTLPNMTEDIANSILDWIDPDDEPRTDGAETDYYSSLSPPYRAKNGPLDSLEELLFVKGVTPQLLLGNDQNRNGVLDPEEDDGSGTLDRGWAPYLTISSREQNVDSQGNPRINVNDPDLDTLKTKLTNAVGTDLANFIVNYRTYGAASASSTGSSPTAPSPNGKAKSSGSVPASPTVQPMSRGSQTGSGTPKGGATGASSSSRQAPSPGNSGGGRQQKIASLFTLINTSASTGGNNPPMPSPLNDPGAQQQLLPLLLDECTTSNAQEIPARINVNTASQTVLMALPNITATDVQSILATRPSPLSSDAPDPIFQTPAWLLTEAHLSLDTLKSLESYITARTQVYRVQVVGYFDNGGSSARVEAVIDVNQGHPRIITYRDLTELGKGFNLAAIGNGGQTP